MKTINLTKTIGVIFLFLFACFSHNSNEFTKSFKANFLKFCLLFVAVLVFPNIGFSQETGGPYTTDDNTVLLMHFEDNVENSANVGVNGILHGSGISYETSIYGHGNCIRIDNSTAEKQSWIEVPFYDELNFSEEFSIECWFKINSWGDGHTGLPILFQKGEGWPADYNLEFGASENRLQANLNCQNDEYEKGFNTGTYPGVIHKGKWYHISLTFKPQIEPDYWLYMDMLIRDENYNEVYANTSFGPTPPFNSNGKLFIGFGNSSNSYFDGWIDEFRISNKARKYRDDIIAEINTENFKDSVPPMLRDRWTTYYPPIINYFPIDTVTGKYKGNSCGMTIMIRMLHFWEHPRFPSGNIDYWFGSIHWQADFDNTEYLFDLMPNKFGPDPTEEEYGPSAIFAQQVSAATRIYYDNMSSMPQFLTDYFHYKKGMKLYFRNQFTKEEWIKIFKHELSHGRPIMAAGLEEIFDEGGAAGHYYIVDGYNSEGKFHSDESFGEVDFWVDIDSFPYGKFQTIFIGTEPDWEGKTLTLDYPKGDEYLQKQTQTEIKWTSTNVNTVLLEYSTDAGKNWQTIAENIDASLGKYLWTIPETISKEYKVRVNDTEDGNIYRRCKIFEVFDQQTFTFEHPQENNTFQQGVKTPIYWNSDGIYAIKIEYSTNGTDWIVVCDSVKTNDGICNWNIPPIVEGEVTLKATSLNDDELSFRSESFTVNTQNEIGSITTDDDKTLLLMHFEEDVSNSANNGLVPKENSTGNFIENYNLNLGKAYRFNNSSTICHNVFVNGSETVDIGNNWTIEAWVNIKSIGDDKTGYFPIIIEKAESFGIFIDQNYFAFKNGFHGFTAFSNGSRLEFFQNQELDFDTWYHVAMISDSASGTVNFFIHDENRNLVYEEYRPFPEGSNGELKSNENIINIGGLGGASNRQFDGFVDEVRVAKSSSLFNYLELTELPFSDDFEKTISDDATFTKWTTNNLEGWHYWHMVTGQGYNGSQCMRFENTDIDQNDWLITKPINTSGINRLNISFDNFYNRTGVKPKLLYKILYKDSNASDWIELEYSLGETENEWNSTGNLVIEDLGDAIYFAFQYEASPDNAIYFLLDNFNITGTITNTLIKTIPESEFKIYPNPLTNTSIITFTNSISGKVNLSVFDLQGRKIYTVLDKNMTQGKHTVSLGNQIKENGIYFCTLTTKTERETLKLVVNR